MMSLEFFSDIILPVSNKRKTSPQTAKAMAGLFFVYLEKYLKFVPVRSHEGT
jgi:hypothetical protein